MQHRARALVLYFCKYLQRFVMQHRARALVLPFNLRHRLQIGLAKASQLTDYPAHAIPNDPPSIRIGLDSQSTFSA